MSEPTDPPSPENGLSDMPRERAVEYLLQQQGQIDALTAKTSAQRIRIRKLEDDREKLRQRLAATRSSRLRSRRARAPTVDAPAEVASQEQATEPRLPIRVGAIVDPFTEQTFGPEWAMMNLRRASWLEDLERHQPELLFVESAFMGSGREWAGELARFGTSSEILQDVVKWCNLHDVPTVFWNKEDPINFELFVKTAQLFDFIFSVDLDSVERYKRHVGSTPVELLPFAAQPLIHFPPLRVEERTREVMFAGGYYAAKHPARRSQMEIILDPARQFDFDIFDRFLNADYRFRWPAKYQAHVRGNLSYQETVEAYRQYKVSLNVNTVTTSSTMCSRRIFELLACGAYIVSGPSGAIGAYVPSGLVHVASSTEEAHRLIERGLSDRLAIEAAAASGPEWIASGQTYSDRVDRILEVVKI